METTRSANPIIGTTLLAVSVSQVTIDNHVVSLFLYFKSLFKCSIKNVQVFHSCIVARSNASSTPETQVREM